MFEIKPRLGFATTREEIEAAWSFVHDNYVEAGIINPVSDGMFLKHSSPDEETLVIIQKDHSDKIVATCTLYMTGYKPCFHQFNNEVIGLVHSLPDKHDAVIEICQLAGKTTRHIINLFRVIHRVGQIMCKDVLAVVHPKHYDFYKDNLGFLKISESKEMDDSGIMGPGELIWLAHRDYAAYQKMMLRWDKKPLGFNVLDIESCTRKNTWAVTVIRRREFE